MKTMISLFFRYFTDPRFQPQLLPTLLAYIHAAAAAAAAPGNNASSTVKYDHENVSSIVDGTNFVVAREARQQRRPGLALSPAWLQCVRAYVTCLEVQKQKLIEITNGDKVDGIGGEGMGNNVVMNRGDLNSSTVVMMHQQLCLLSQRLPMCLWHVDLLGSE